MSLIERYILRRIAMITVSALMVTTILALTTQVLIRVNLLASTGQSLLTIGELALYLVPTVMTIVAPFALLIGIVQTLQAMNQDTELVVLDASGVSLARKARPVMVAATGVAVLVAALALVIEPVGEQRMRALLAEASGSLLQSAIRSGAFTRMGKDLYMQVGETLPGGGLSQIYIADRREADTSLIYYARRGQMVEENGRNLLVVEDGQIHQRKTGESAVSVVSFQSYALDPATFSSATGGELRSVKERPTAELFAPPLDDKVFQDVPHLFREEIHRRFSAMLYPLAMALAAAYFVGQARSNRQASGAATALGITAAVSIRAIGFALNASAGKSLIAAVASYALPIAAVLFFAWLIIFDIRLSLAGRLANAHDRASQWFARLRTRREGVVRS